MESCILSTKLRQSTSVVSADLALLMVLSLEKENITKKDRSVLADKFCLMRLLLHSQSCCMPLGLPIRDKGVPHWRRSRHNLRVESHLSLAGR